MMMMMINLRKESKVMMMMMIKLREESKVMMRMIRDQGEVLALGFNPHIQILATGRC